MYSVSAIIVNYNGRDFLKNCLNSLYNQDFHGRLEIIVIDNNSSDNSVEFIKMNYPDVTLLENSKNVGHSAACNQGAKIAKGDFLLFLDNDVILQEDFITELLKVFGRKKDCGIAGGMVKDLGTNFIQELGINIDILGYPISNIGTMFGYIIEDKNQYNEIFETFYVSSCALMIPRNLFLKVGGFDDKYFIYKDDLDLCWRVKLLGYKVYVNPKARIYHKMGVTLGGSSSEIIGKMKYTTTPLKRYYGERNTLRTLIKNYEIKTLLWILPIYIFMNIGEILYFLSKRNLRVVKSYIDAWIWNIKNFKDTLKERRRIQSFRKVSDKEIMKEMYHGFAKLRIYKTFMLKNSLEIR